MLRHLLSLSIAQMLFSPSTIRCKLFLSSLAYFTIPRSLTPLEVRLCYLLMLLYPVFLLFSCVRVLLPLVPTCYVLRYMLTLYPCLCTCSYFFCFCFVFRSVFFLSGETCTLFGVSLFPWSFTLDTLLTTTEDFNTHKTNNQPTKKWVP